MILNTTRFGVIEVDDKAVISMPEGMIGFEGHESYCLIDHQRESVFKWLHSTQDPDLAFLVVDPSDVVSDYEVELPDWDVEFLGLKDANEAVVVATVTIDVDSELITANLLAPIVINSRTRIGRQVVLDKSDYEMKHEVYHLRAVNTQPNQAKSKAA